QPVELPRVDNAGVVVAGGVEKEGSEEQGPDELGQESEMESKDEEEVGSRREASERAAEAEAEAGGRRGAEAEQGEEETGARDGSGEVDVTSGGQGQGEGQGQVNGALAQLRGGASGRGAEGGEGGGVEGASGAGAGGEGEGEGESEGEGDREGGGKGVGEWEPLRGPAEGMTCRAWLEEQDEVGVGREFENHPVRVASNEFVSSGDDVDASLTYSVAGKMVLRSMEARSYYPANDPAVSRGSHSVVMTVHYDSDVPVQYGSWEEYDIMRPPVPKTADAIAAAFISNCAANNFRLKVRRKG
ncbi:unnamed protein product, partial [Closterium sp. NIES-54]